MTDDQLGALFAHEREETGAPKLDHPVPVTRRPDEREMFEKQMALLGVTEPHAKAALWREQKGTP